MTSAPLFLEANDPEINYLKQEALGGNLQGIRQYLLRSQQAQDWQDRCYLLSAVSSFLRHDALAAASAAEPEAADLFLLLGAHFLDNAGRSRGTRTADQTSAEQFGTAEMHITSMMNALVKACALQPDDPTPHVFAIRGLIVSSGSADYVKQEYREAIRAAPDCVPAHYAMINARSKKWGGSHEESLSLARAAAASGRPGSDLPGCLFYAHFFVWQYARIFDKNKPEADSYLKNPGVNQELNAALSRWIDDGYKTRRSSLSYLHHAAVWYYLSGDYSRLRQVFALTGSTPAPLVWGQIGNAAKVYDDALQKVVPAPPKKTGLLGWFR